MVNGMEEGLRKTYEWIKEKNAQVKR